MILLLLAVVGGGWIDHNETLRGLFDHEGLTLAWVVIAYGFGAAVMPVWLLLAPRDYLSTFVKAWHRDAFGNGHCCFAATNSHASNDTVY